MFEWLLILPTGAQRTFADRREAELAALEWHARSGQPGETSHLYRYHATCTEQAPGCWTVRDRRDAGAL